MSQASLVKSYIAWFLSGALSLHCACVHHNQEMIVREKVLGTANEPDLEHTVMRTRFEASDFEVGFSAPQKCRIQEDQYELTTETARAWVRPGAYVALAAAAGLAIGGLVLYPSEKDVNEAKAMMDTQEVRKLEDRKVPASVLLGSAGVAFIAAAILSYQSYKKRDPLRERLVKAGTPIVVGSEKCKSVPMNLGNEKVALRQGDAHIVRGETNSYGVVRWPIASIAPSSSMAFLDIAPLSLANSEIQTVGAAKLEWQQEIELNLRESAAGKCDANRLNLMENHLVDISNALHSDDSTKSHRIVEKRFVTLPFKFEFELPQAGQATVVALGVDVKSVKLTNSIGQDMWQTSEIQRVIRAKMSQKLQFAYSQTREPAASLQMFKDPKFVPFRTLDGAGYVAGTNDRKIQADIDGLGCALLMIYMR